MKVIILGAGIMGVSTAWYLLEHGCEVTVVERQSHAALETSFANGAQISVSYCEPWASRSTPLKALKWMLSKEAPLLFRPRPCWQQWRWSLLFLSQCHDRAFERNVQQLVALGSYSHAALKELVATTGISYQRLQKGIAHYYCDAKSFASARQAAALMARYGVVRQVIDSAELLTIEPALRPFAKHIVGGTFTPSDESGDALVFTQELAKRCMARGAEFLYHHQVQALNQAGGAIRSVGVRDLAMTPVNSKAQAPLRLLQADHVVVACGCHSANLLRQVGVDLPIYPGKGYSATFDILRTLDAPQVSLLDDSKKIAISRLGNRLRVAGTIEVGDYNLTLDSPLAKARCRMLSKLIEDVFPGVCDTREVEQGGNPRYWTGLRPATPSNVPYIGATSVGRLWVNAGHGTLGWTHGAGSGKALADLICGQKPELDFPFYGLA